MTADQKDQVKSITTAARFKMRGFGARGEPPNREDAEAARQAASLKLLAVLTEEQQAKWKELLGAPFTGEIKRP